MLPTPAISPFATPFATMEPLQPMNALTPEEAADIAAYLRTLPEFQPEYLRQQAAACPPPPLPFPRQNAFTPEEAARKQAEYAPLVRQNAMTEEECKAFSELMDKVRQEEQRQVSPFANMVMPAPSMAVVQDNFVFAPLTRQPGMDFSEIMPPPLERCNAIAPGELLGLLP